jgi:transcriptional regulator with XRE-family HTH domain
MGRPSKKNLPPAKILGYLAENIVKLRDRKYRHLANDTARNKALAKDVATSPSQIQRIAAGQLAIGVDLLERLADALDVRPADLVTPYFATSALAALAAQHLEPQSMAVHEPVEKLSVAGRSRRATY